MNKKDNSFLRQIRNLLSGVESGEYEMRNASLEMPFADISTTTDKFRHCKHTSYIFVTMLRRQTPQTRLRLYDAKSLEQCAWVKTLLCVRWQEASSNVRSCSTAESRAATRTRRAKNDESRFGNEPKQAKHQGRVARLFHFRRQCQL